MNIICVARNYAPHAKEMHTAVPTEPIFFMKPDSALNQKQTPFFYPDFSKDIHHEVELVVKINRLGKCIQPQFAHKYYNAVALGIDFTARDLQKNFKEHGMPWLLAKGFDGSAAIGPFVELEEMEKTINDLHFDLKINGTLVQQGYSGEMIFDVDHLIAYLSRFITLRTGDLIYTGTPAGVGPVKIGDHLEGTIEGKPMLSLDIK